jgi:hypothetical protein
LKEVREKSYMQEIMVPITADFPSEAMEGKNTVGTLSTRQ